jgi:hypothetical protein
MATYLITSEEIRLNTPMGGNVDSDKFINFITDVQVMILEPVLGTKLYDKIITDFNSSSLADVYLQMFDDYIKPVIWHSVFAEYVKIGSIIVGNGGMYRHVAQDAEIARLDDINYIAKNAQSKADTYIDRLIRFLCDQDIEEYTRNQDNDYDIDPVDALQTISGWHLTSTIQEGRTVVISNNGSGGNDNYLELE